MPMTTVSCLPSSTDWQIMESTNEASLHSSMHISMLLVEKFTPTTTNFCDKWTQIDYDYCSEYNIISSKIKILILEVFAISEYFKANNEWHANNSMISCMGWGQAWGNQPQSLIKYSKPPTLFPAFETVAKKGVGRSDSLMTVITMHDAWSDSLVSVWPKFPAQHQCDYG